VTKDPMARRSQCHLSPSDLPVAPKEEEPPTSLLPLSEELGAGGAMEPASTAWEPPVGTPGIWIPRWGSRPPVWWIATPLSSRVGSQASTADRSPRSSQSCGMPWGGIEYLGIKASPVIPFSSWKDRSVPGPR
jgi:hypothetical protein